MATASLFDAIETHRSHTNTSVTTHQYLNKYISIFFAGEADPLGAWDKQVRKGSINRRWEGPLFHGQKPFRILEVLGTNYASTFITCPKLATEHLEIKLFNMVIVCKNIRRYFAFEVQLVDVNGCSRQFRFSNAVNIAPKLLNFMCCIPLRLQDGWNDVFLDLQDLNRRLYGTDLSYIARVQIWANTRIQQVFFIDDEIFHSDVPVPSMKMFDNVKILSPNFVPYNHPSFKECGPEKTCFLPISEPQSRSNISRVEEDLAILNPRRAKVMPQELIDVSSLNKSKLNLKKSSGVPTRRKVPIPHPPDVIHYSIPEIETAVKLLETVKKMNLNPSKEGTLYMAQLEEIRRDLTNLSELRQDSINSSGSSAVSSNGNTNTTAIPLSIGTENKKSTTSTNSKFVAKSTASSKKTSISKK